MTPLIYHRLNPSEAVPFLQQKGVISHDEAAEIRNIETQKSRSHAALELQYILPNRQRHWYELTIRSLVESEQCELAEEIDAKLTKTILENSGTDISLCSDEISLLSARASIKGLEDVAQSGHDYTDVRLDLHNTVESHDHAVEGIGADKLGEGWTSLPEILTNHYRNIEL